MTAAQDGWDGENDSPQNSMLDNDRLLECKWSFVILIFVLLRLNYSKVYRVNWLRARATSHRWEEELPRTEMEMIWTTRYFMHERDLWYGRLANLREQGSSKPGHEAYCEQKISQWEEYARIAAFQFRKANEDFPNVWIPIVTRL
jgi:hypothetical protein